MVKKSLNGVDSRLVFRETFNSYADVVKNGGEINNEPTISNGIFYSNDTDDTYIDYNKVFNGVYTVRCKVRLNDSVGLGDYIFDGRSNSGTGYMIISDSGFTRSSGDIYVDGNAGSFTPSQDIWYDYVVTDITLDTSIFAVSRYWNSLTSTSNFDFALLEVYEGTLTAEEISALYKNTLYTPPAKEVVGSDLVTNGSFDTDTDWTKETGWTIANGVASQDGTGAGYTGDLAQSLSIDAGETYRVSFEIKNYTSGTLNVVLGYDASDSNAVSASANGRYSEIVTSGSNTILYIHGKPGANFIGSIDNVVVERVYGEVININANRGMIVEEQGNTINTLNSVKVLKDKTNVMDINYTSIEMDNLGLSGDLTLGFWIYVPTLISASRFVLNDDSKLQIFFSNTSMYMRSNGSTITGTANNILEAGKWIRIVNVRQSDGTWEVFKNGVSTGSAVASGTPSDGSGTMFIGGYSSSVGFNNSLQNDWFIRRGLWSAEEVARDYNSSKQRYNK